MTASLRTILHESHSLHIVPWMNRKRGTSACYYRCLPGYFLLAGISIAVLWALLVINLAAVIITTVLLAAMLSEQQVSPWISMIYIFYIGTLFFAQADLNGPPALALSLLGWFVYRRWNLKLAVVLFALAGVAKEIGLMFPLAIAYWEVFHKRQRNGVMVLGFRVIPYFILFSLLRFRWDNSSSSLLPQWLPFVGITALQDRIFLTVVGIWILIPIVILLGFLIKDFLKRNQTRLDLETFMLLVNIVFLSIIPYQTWEDPLAIFRLAIPLVIAAFMWMAKNHRRLLPYMTGLWASSCILLFLTPGMFFK